MTVQPFTAFSMPIIMGDIMFFKDISYYFILTDPWEALEATGGDFSPACTGTACCITVRHIVRRNRLETLHVNS